MPRSRIEIQKDINNYRTSLERNEIYINDPMWDDKSDPRYISIVNARDNYALELRKVERELEDAKARGEKGRSLAEINEEISETQSELNEYHLLQNRADNHFKWLFLRHPVVLFQCTLNALQLELNEAIKEGNLKPQKKYSNQEKVARERAEKEKIVKEKAARERAEKERIKKEKNEIAEIKKQYEQRIRKNPNDVNNYKIRAKMYYAKKYYDLAIDDYTKIIEDIDSNDKDSYVERAIMYSEKKEYKKAIDDFTKAIGLDPNDADNYALRGMVYATTGEYDKAIADYDKAIKLDPKCKNAYLGKGAIYSVKGEHDKSFANYKKLSQLAPTDSTFTFFLENARKANEEQQRERREETKKITSRIFCVSAPFFALISIVLIFVLGTSESDLYSKMYVPLVFNIIPFLVIYFSDSDRRIRKTMFLIIDIVYFIIVYREYGTKMDIHFYFVLVVITNLISVVLAMLFPKDKWYYF